jgi:molybdopterin molybdotransferase
VSELLSIDQALQLVLARAVALEPEEVPVDEAAGRVLAAPALAAVDLPPFPSSAMDGFAVRANDVPGSLSVVGSIAAGRPAAAQLAAGEAMAISTGGAVPDGADAVVPIEAVEVRPGSVVIKGNVERGAFVRGRGGDIAAGALVVAAGARLEAAQVGALAAAGIRQVTCARVPRVAVLVTGTELRASAEPLGPGEIYDSNGPMLAAQLRSAGAAVERLPAVSDDVDALRAALERGLAADVLVTTGGVSVGVHDLVRATEAELGVEEVFWGVAMRPGKPLAFGVRSGTLVFGLPGNPVSALVGFELFVRSALLALQGASEPGPAFRPGRLVRATRRNGARDSLLRARSSADGDAVLLEPVTGQESHMIARAATADALVLVPRGDGELAAGSAVSYLAL